ncbi:hypothetical protein F5Y13DRAFT_185041 [Hypoxylon sp. FL1857]|nr:hypothetical protein F5Y13DRAFT_185041 [Hypoxylon sp. FL1857]
MALKYSLTIESDSSKDANHHDREVLRLYGFRSSVTGNALSKLAKRVTNGLMGLDAHPSVTFEPFYFFFYGSLQLPRVVKAVCQMNLSGPDPELKAGTIKGWETMMWSIYPALLPKAGNVVKGLYWKCENPFHVFKLRNYEGQAYRMEFCEITTDQGEVIENGRVFVSTMDKTELNEGIFDLEEYSKRGRLGG